MKQTKVYNLLVVDESGSMEIIKQQTINGCNETLQTIQSAQEKYPEQNHLVTLVFFNSCETKTIVDCIPVSKTKPLNESNYNPNCNTPLFDALGESLTRLRYKINQEERLDRQKQRQYSTACAHLWIRLEDHQSSFPPRLCLDKFAGIRQNF